MAEVEDRAGGDHRMVGVRPGLGSRQQGRVQRLDLRRGGEDRQPDSPSRTFLDQPTATWRNTR